MRFLPSRWFLSVTQCGRLEQPGGAGRRGGHQRLITCYWIVAQLGSPPLPESLGDVCALVNNIPLPLFSVSPGQLVAQLPYISGTGSLVVHNSGGVSDPFSFTIQATSARHLPNRRDYSGISVTMTTSLVDFTNPVHPNSALTIYVTGLGLTTPLPPLGTAAPATPPAVVVDPADGDTRRRLIGGNFGNFGAWPDWSLYDQCYGSRKCRR